MAKVSGITTSVTVGGNNISNDVTSITLNTPTGTQDVTGVDKTGVERLSLLKDMSGTLTGAFNTTASMSHDTLKTPGVKTFVIGFPGATATFSAVTTDYALTRGQDGSLAWSVPFEMSDGTGAVWS